MAKRKLTSYEKEYQRQRKNYLERVRYYSKKGIIISKDKIPTITELIKRGESERNIKAKTINLKREKGEKVTEYQEYKIDPETGEILVQYDPRTHEVIYEAPKEEVIDVSIIEKIREEITELPDMVYGRRGATYDLVEKKNALISLLDDTVTFSNDLYSLVEYYKENQNILFDNGVVVAYASDEEIVTTALSRIATYINGGGALSQSQSSMISDYADYIG